jgi:hypothetical protein
MDPTAGAIDVALAVGFHAIGNADALPTSVAHIRPFLTVPSPDTSKTRMCPRTVSLTYSFVSSIEKQSPLGCSKSSTS